MPLDLTPIRERLWQTGSGFWENDCRSLDDCRPQDREFIYHAPGDVSDLLDEVERLRAAVQVQSTVVAPCRLCGAPMALAEAGSGPGDEDLYRCSRAGCSGEYVRDNAEPRFIVRLEPGVWIAGWNGDPGQTTVKASAKRFPTERSARRALSKARRFREFPLAVVECVK